MAYTRHAPGYVFGQRAWLWYSAHVADRVWFHRPYPRVRNKPGQSSRRQISKLGGGWWNATHRDTRP